MVFFLLLVISIYLLSQYTYIFHTKTFSIVCRTVWKLWMMLSSFVKFGKCEVWNHGIPFCGTKLIQSYTDIPISVVYFHLTLTSRVQLFNVPIQTLSNLPVHVLKLSSFLDFNVVPIFSFLALHAETAKVP